MISRYELHETSIIPLPRFTMHTIARTMIPIIEMVNTIAKIDPAMIAAEGEVPVSPAGKIIVSLNMLGKID